MVAVVKRPNTADCGSVIRGFESLQSPHLIINLILGRSQVGKARDFDSRMRWFESSRPSQYDPLAQAVEHLTFNQGVDGSSPSWVTSQSIPDKIRDAFFVEFAGMWPTATVE